jgi:tRNA(adenine34) deaminase
LIPLLEEDRRWMKRALMEAEQAYEEGEVPIGAVVVNQEGIIGRGHNRVEALGDPTAHAEMLAITAACDTVSEKFLTDATLYVTVEPCPMCAGAIVWARIERLVFGAFDEKAGSCSTLYNIPRDERLNHQTDIISGVEAQRARELLQQFFHERRESSNSS